jgi:hypothetical protein
MPGEHGDGAGYRAAAVSPDFDRSAAGQSGCLGRFGRVRVHHGSQPDRLGFATDPLKPLVARAWRLSHRRSLRSDGAAWPYYDPNIGLVLQNNLETKPKYFGIGNYNEEGFAFMAKGVTIGLDTFKKALTHTRSERLLHECS